LRTSHAMSQPLDPFAASATPRVDPSQADLARVPPPPRRLTPLALTLAGGDGSSYDRLVFVVGCCAAALSLVLAFVVVDVLTGGARLLGPAGVGMLVFPALIAWAIGVLRRERRTSVGRQDAYTGGHAAVGKVEPPRVPLGGRPGYQTEVRWSFFDTKGRKFTASAFVRGAPPEQLGIPGRSIIVLYEPTDPRASIPWV
jgi:hypothetical protein